MTDHKSMPLRITLRRCSKTFPNGTRALEPLDLVVQPGECLVLLGPSGCGKTTLLRIIAGLADPDSGGRILFGDQDVTPLPIEARKVGMVFQSYALFPNMNVAQNIGYGLRIRGDAKPAVQRRVEELLQLVQMEGYGSRRIDELSGGQKQRVALARAMAIEPSVLLLDEPLTALDAKLRESLRIELKRLLATLGVTSVFVTHDQAEAMALGDRIAVLSKGRIEQIGTSEDIYHRPATGFVAEFIGRVNRISLPGHGEVLVRPEDVGMYAHGETRVRSGAAQTTLVELSGLIRQATFLGSLTHFEVELAGGQIIMVEGRGGPTTLPSALHHPGGTAAVAAAIAGTSVLLCFDPATFLRPRS